jgi:hypothetical protein
MFVQQSEDGPLLLADISGYSSFLQAVADAHRDDAFANGAIPEAYGMMSSLLDGIVGKIIPPFSLAKLEGDAVFAFAAAGAEVPHGDAFLACIRTCYADFRERLGQVGEIWTCTCAACSRAGGLELKFIVHAGPYVVQQVAGSRELIGAEVVLAHRLLKNGAAALVGHGAYALITRAAADRLGVPTGDARPLAETYEPYASVDTFVYALR